MNRIVARAKFFFDGDRKFLVQGVTYGPFRPAGEGAPYLPDPGRVVEDFRRMREAGINVVRVYHHPPRWFLDLARDHGLRVLTTIPWPLRGLFLDSAAMKAQIRKNVRESAREHAGHPALFGFYVDNEMQPDLVRWYGPRRVEQFLDSLIALIKQEDPGALVSYANFPPTEYLQPGRVDFYSYNVYLHDMRDFRGYLARLQNLAGEKPLLFGEFGMDTIRHAQEEQADLIAGHLQEVFSGGAAGTILFAWTDEWFTGGMDITDWAFGLTTVDRAPKRSYHRLAAATLRAGDSLWKKFPAALPWPKASVVVCSYNGAPTLRGCLEALEKLEYPDFEIIVVDDGSKDNTQDILRDFPRVINIRQENKGLSVARNVGAAAATGEIIAYTDSDCMPDPDWLYFLVHTLLSEPFAAVGGPNISPPAVNWVQAAVAAAPGSPSHVLVSDKVAEHVPGCNMAFHRWALDMIGGFDPVYRKAGDDVDVFWRLIQCGQLIGFSAAAVVWHHRRFTVRAYFNQQKGYGEAEALLRYKHLNFFDSSGSARWKGVIYGVPMMENVFGKPVIYHGVFGMGFFQSIYRRPPMDWTWLVGSLPWNALTIFILFISSQVHFLRVVPLLMAAMTLAGAMAYMASVRIEARHDTIPARLLLLYLAWAQPLARTWARTITWLAGKRTPAAVLESKEEEPHEAPPVFGCGKLNYWSENGKDRSSLLESTLRLLDKEGWKYVTDNGWGDWDIEIFADRWWHIRLRTLSEYYPQGKMMVRVANSPVLNSFTILMAVLLAGAVTVFCLAFEAARPVILIAALLQVSYWFIRGMLIRHRVAELVEAAAHSLDLTPVRGQSRAS
jgi:glycosyltransferase involved in cell wall biosynthesis